MPSKRTPEPIRWRGITLTWALEEWAWNIPSAKPNHGWFTIDVSPYGSAYRARIRGHDGYGLDVNDALESAFSSLLREHGSLSRIIAAVEGHDDT